MFSLNQLPYNKNEFKDFLSENTLNFHHGKHLQTYIDNTNKLIKDTDLENKSLVYIIQNSQGGIFNNASQVFNHEFYFNCITPNPCKCIAAPLKTLIEKNFKTVEAFFDAFIQNATGNFGSGWTWLVQQNDELKIVNTQNAHNPIENNLKPLLTVDVWEHAYYLDYQNRRADYLKDFCKHINFDYVLENLNRA